VRVYGNNIALKCGLVEVHIDTAVLVIVSVCVSVCILQYVKLWSYCRVHCHSDAGEIYCWCLGLTVK
jgi:hypothetical protein